jgi:purine-binding chemotaxis protein CheW
MSSAQDTVQKYFEELLTDVADELEHAAEAPPNNPSHATVTEPKNVTVKQSQAAAKARSTARPATPPIEAKQAAMPLRSTAATQKVASPVSRAAEPELVDEKKHELQKLLASRTLTPKLTFSKPSEAQPQEAQPPEAQLSSTKPNTTEALAVENEEARGATEAIAPSQPRESTKPNKDGGRPDWAEQPFEALLFEVCGLTLAVPLITLGQIVPLERDKLTSIFGQSDWFIGMLPSPIGRLRIVNTALFVMPEKYQDGFIDDAQYAISLDGVPWALAVDKVNQPVRLDPSEVKWRTGHSKRPWLAGTVKSAMCALLDVPQMSAMMNASDGNLELKEQESQ